MNHVGFVGMGGAAPPRAARMARLVLHLVFLLAFGTPVVAQTGSLDGRVFEIAGKLRCPVCVSESVADSNSRVAVEMRELIQQQVEQGRTDRQIFAYFQERYGDWILLEPPRRGIHLLVWLLPVVVALVGAVGLALFVRRWLAAGRETPDVDPADLERVRHALEASDGPPRHAANRPLEERTAREEP